MLDSLSNCLSLLEICPKCCLIAIFQVNSLFLDMMEIHMCSVFYISLLTTCYILVFLLHNEVITISYYFV